MTTRVEKSIALCLSLGAGLVLSISLALLVVDYAIARQRAPLEAEQIRKLEDAAREDASRVPEVEAEFERQTEAKHERAARHRIQAYVVIVSTIVFLAGAKWLLYLRGPSAPDLATIEWAHEELRRRREGGRRRWRPRRAPSSAEGNGSAAEVTPPPIDLSFVDAVVAREGRGKEVAIPIVQAIQSYYRYLPDEALRRVCELTEISPSQIAGVTSFYSQFRRSPAGKHTIKICHGTACHVARAQEITDEIRRYLQIPPSEDTDPGWLFTVDEVACLGCCSLAPVIAIDDQTAGKLTPVHVRDVIEEFHHTHDRDGK